MAGGAPKGNQNAVQENRQWLAMLRRKVAQNPAKLEQAALAVLDAAANGEPWAITELGNRLDGKPVQQVDMKVNTETPSLSSAYLAHVAAGGKPDEYNGETVQ